MSCSCISYELYSADMKHMSYVWAAHHVRGLKQTNGTKGFLTRTSAMQTSMNLSEAWSFDNFWTPRTTSHKGNSADFEGETGEIKIGFLTWPLVSLPKLRLNRASLNKDTKGFDVVNFGFQPLLPLNNCRSDVGKTSNTDFCHNFGFERLSIWAFSFQFPAARRARAPLKTSTCTKSTHKKKKTETSSPTSHVPPCIKNHRDLSSKSSVAMALVESSNRLPAIR